MKYYEIWHVADGRWRVYEVTDYTHYRFVKSYKTRADVESWAKKQWYRVTWL